MPGPNETLYPDCPKGQIRYRDSDGVFTCFDTLVRCDSSGGDIDLDAPGLPCVGPGSPIVIENKGPNTVTVIAAPGETIEGEPSLSLPPWSSVTLMKDSSHGPAAEWVVVACCGPVGPGGLLGAEAPYSFVQETGAAPLVLDPTGGYTAWPSGASILTKGAPFITFVGGFWTMGPLGPGIWRLSANAIFIPTVGGMPITMAFVDFTTAPYPGAASTLAAPVVAVQNQLSLEALVALGSVAPTNVFSLAFSHIGLETISLTDVQVTAERISLT